MNPRQVLNKFKWTFGLEGIKIVVLHRGAPEDRRTIHGENIIELDKSFFHTPSATIPYHRVLRIEHKGKVVWERKT